MTTQLIKQCLNHCTRMSFEKEKIIPRFSLHCEADISCLDCDLEDVANYKISEVPLWTSKSPTYLYNLASDKKAITDPFFFLN